MKTINIQPVRMTPQVMQMLEKHNLIIRLYPSHHRNEIKPHDCVGTDLYVSAPGTGTHKLIAVTVDRVEFSMFGSHKDNEEFLLIGGEGEKPLYLLVALLKKQDLLGKIHEGTLCGSDFICLDCVFNDAQVSFFTMLKDVPHGEATRDDGGLPSSFYVAEPSDMGLEVMDLREYQLRLEIPSPSPQ
jgi:hypothetical protein